MFGKLFASMYEGSLRTRSPWQALVTFQQLIVLANKHGEVDMTAEALSFRTGIPLEIIQTGIASLLEPDPDSRSKVEEGRRIVPLEDTRSWGWTIVNYEHYRKIRSEDERREYMRDLMRKRRAKAKPLAPVSDVSPGSKQYAVSRKQDDVTTKMPNADDSVEIGLIRQYGDKWDSARLFLDQRDLRTRPAWVKEIATLTMHYGSEVIAQACNDAAAAEDPVKVPAGLRAFAARIKEAKTKPSTNGASRPSPQSEAQRAVAAIRSLIATSQQPGQAQVRFIPIAGVRGLGDKIAKAYQEVGGAERFLSTTGENISFLIRDFAIALGT